MTAASSNRGIFSSSDLLFLLTFAAGMGAFWLSGQAPVWLHLPVVKDPTISFVMNLGLALVVYGIIMFGWAWLLSGRNRSLKGALMAALVAAGLALVSSLAMTWLGGHVNFSLAVLAFILYLVYGTIFVIGWSISRKRSSRQ